MHAETNLHPLMAQALAAFAPPQSEVHREVIAAERINDDDLYEFDAQTHEMFAQHSPQRQDLAALLRWSQTGMAMLHDGHMLARGMRIKHLGLWVRRSVPVFLMQGATA